MIYHDVSQGSDEWFRMRLGVATASCFDKIITPKTGEISKSAEKYANQLVGEMICGENSEKFQSYWMERGALMEPKARAQYEIITDYTLDRGGFVTNDDMTIGASPDVRVVNPSTGKIIGAAEIKCPAPDTHIENLKRAFREKKIDPSYIPQVQGQILVGEFDFVDWFSYHPDMPPAHIRTNRDDAFCDKLEYALNEFIGMVEETIFMFERIGLIVPPRPIIMMHKSAQAKVDDQIPDYLSGG